MGSVVRQKHRAGRIASQRAESPQSVTEPSRMRGPANFLQSTLGLGLLGSLLVFISLPPLDFWPLAWVAPVPWLLLARQEKLGGRRPYRALWIAGFAFWLAAIHWLRLPHWTTYFGWLALSFYLAFYLPVFIGLTRIAVHRLRISIVLAAPIVWTGLELARGHLLGGFTMGSLSHTQIHWLSIIQSADVIACYGVSGLVMLVAACVARMVPWRGQRITIWPVLSAAIALVAAFAYGQWRMSGEHSRPGPKVALIQGSVDAELKADAAMRERVMEEYLRLSAAALREQPNIDLVVWPETMYRDAWIEFEPNFIAPAEWTTTPQKLADDRREILHDLQAGFGSIVAAKFGGAMPPPLLLGLEAVHISSDAEEHEVDQHFNSALFIDSRGEPLARYDKMHPVMFGEYIPLAEYFPILYRITPLTGGLTTGTKAVAQKLGPFRYAPDICYETVIPHLIRWQVRQLREQGEEPDVLVNVTNDGWFRGSSELDMHLACAVFRAIEMRKPIVIAANTGFSASIDADGRIERQAKRRQSDILIADVQLDTRHSFYLDHGDWWPGLCLLLSVGLALVGAADRWFLRKAIPATQPSP
jgi:apolipoprotein N-acyltransferase